MIFGSKATFALDLGTRFSILSNSRQILLRDNSQALSHGVISDVHRCSETVRRGFSRFFPRFRSFELLLSAPLDISAEEKAAFRKAAELSGADEVFLVPEPAAAVAGLVPNFMNKKGIALIDVGAGITEFVIFSEGQVLKNSSIRFGGNDFEKILQSYFLENHGFSVSVAEAREVIETLIYQRSEMFLRDNPLPKELARHVKMNALELDRILDEVFAKIVETTATLLSGLPASVHEEISENGLYLTGGASQFPRLHEMIEEKLNLRINPDPQPLLGVARGEIQLLQNPELMKAIARNWRK